MAVETSPRGKASCHFQFGDIYVSVEQCWPQDNVTTSLTSCPCLYYPDP